MKFNDFLDTYKGDIKEVIIGKEGKSVVIGGENTLPFHYFEGSIPHKPLLALEVWDTIPANWSPHLLSVYQDVLQCPVAWAKKCLNTYNADLVSLYLSSADEENANPTTIAENVKKIAEALPVPLVVYGLGDKDRDVPVLKEVARVCAGEGMLLGPVLKDNYEEIGKAALEYGHSIIAQTPIDINLSKELNVKLSKFFPRERIVIDPLSSALGYGLDYSFSIMERVKQVGVIHGDELMKMPIIGNVGRDSWKTKEAKESKEQGIMWEALTALTLALAGANLLILSHPESMHLVRKTIG
ncbi:MAG: Corrinoid/iron-sulfur protein small subunit [candidate division WS2 bacterium]|uniref:Corrinoid/iron-sulfur protein small subunit n=1 Tax=Psychracetigena formicireducens TaxID=2986056 RepID=A0A9E2BGC9_PSYF1|nr:Corrinoid/iron-sulfur protein small subunit [Candidatus Psychracetigena formicireducens]MBT9145007.1 Corrinoid/iron-sulfur protein small subunit [Candidatus Psychracetigena formicireducens]MBT9150249.1 Corrinoid/iron-sulfur protein small subunit [Candidatus Psychracetigena formicireducens]